MYTKLTKSEQGTKMIFDKDFRFTDSKIEFKDKDNKIEDDTVLKQDEADNVKSFEQVLIAEKQREKMAALGQLAGGIAHDFNNQLMSIIGNATMIQKTDDIEKIKNYADRIIHISQSTASLIKKILMFSKKESTINEMIDLKNVMDNTYYMIESILDKKIEVKYSYKASSSLVVGNETQIENLIINLVINSRDAMNESSGTIKIGTEDTVVFYDCDLSHGEVIKPGEYIKIYVEDNGSGMSDEAFNKIFEPYYTTKNKAKGTGLGMSVVFGTVKSHSGYVNVKSELNEGTAIEIYLPVMKQEVKASDTDTISEKNNLVMLVDDDENVLDIEAELLEDLGYDVEKFNNPLEALKYYQNNWDKISFNVLDIMMPEMSGKTLYEELQKINKDVTTIFISGYSGQKDFEDLSKMGLSIIEKPFTFADLSSQVAKIYN